MQAILRYWDTTLGKKFLMAVTGAVLFLYVLAHMAGNLQIFAGPRAINRYSEFLHSAPAFLWFARAVLLFCVLVHILAAVQITVRNWGTRSVRYAVRHYREADYAARTMVWGGPIIAAFVVYHIFDLTLGDTNPSFVAGEVYRNIVTGFSNPWVAGFYILAVVMLGLHLYHGLWSAFQTVGASHPSYDAARKVFAVLFAVLISAGFASVPVSVLAGVLH